MKYPEKKEESKSVHLFGSFDSTVSRTQSYKLDLTGTRALKSEDFTSKDNDFVIITRRCFLARQENYNIDKMILLMIWAVVLVVVIMLYFRQTYSRFSDNGVKHFKPIPFMGNMTRILFRLDTFNVDLDRMYNGFPEERFIGRYEFIKPIILVRDLELVKKIAIKDFEHFLDHRSFTDELIEPLFARNLFSLKGQEWKDMRSTLSPAFTSSKIKLMVPFMEEVGEQMIQALQKKIKESKHGAIDVDCKDLTSRYANDVIASCAFGLKVDSHTDENNQFFEMGKTAATFKFKQMLMLFAMSACPSLVKRLKLQLFTNETKEFFIDLVMNTMKDREARKIIRPDMIHLLMEAKKGQLSHDDKLTTENGHGERDAGFATVEESTVGKKNTDRVWSDTDLIAQAVLFFIAGFDTISTAMAFALHELAVNPDIQDRLFEEIKEYNEKHNGKLSFTAIQNMTYMDMVVSEVLRLWPPAMALDRICVKDYNMGKPNSKATKDYIIRKGELVSIPSWCFHHDPEFFPNPQKFEPERFSDENKHLINPMAYMPFGLGPRNCIENVSANALGRVAYTGCSAILPSDLLQIHRRWRCAFQTCSITWFVGQYEFVKPIILVRDLELVKKITIKDFDHFLDHRHFTDDVLFARSLFSLKGQEWKDMRSTLSPAFTSSKIKLMVPFMEEVGEQMIQSLRKQIKDSEHGAIDVDCKDLTSRYANDVIASCAFGLKVDSHTDENNQFFEMGKTAAVFKSRQKLVLFAMYACPSLAKRLKLKLFSNETKEFFVNLVMSTIKDREAKHIIRPDMIHLLMEARKGQLYHDDKLTTENERDTGFATVEEFTVGKKTTDRVWSDTDLIAQAVLFFIAGFDTISTAMSFALHELAIHSDIQDRLYKEIKEYDEKHNGRLNFTSIQNMTYMDMVVSEVLRLWPPVMVFDRVCVKDYNMGRPNNKATKDYIIRKGELVSIPSWCFHHDPEFFPNPQKFEPERFSDENKHLINAMAYMPFGLGPRNCIGKILYSYIN
ncbi:jg27298 [Pararge aegeria aegeria]|uniref:unspecific monooxygenase n=1 Tax=Pararge aegeria aegeria TaxID=348720 RepID=A0A8S4SLJ9_9NEOP|nr:jg27298 [Pararge aegeria aegeria]